MKKLLFLVALTASLPLFGQHTTAAEEEALLRHWTKYFASDEFGGRKPMTEYESLTIKAMAAEMEALGLQPAFGGSWYQPFKMISANCKPRGGRFRVKGGPDLRYGDDMVVWTARATDRVQVRGAGIVFAGFGITAPEFGWNDFEGVDVSGKIILALVNDPGYYDEKMFRGRNMTYYGRWLYKFEEARRRGAAGCLVIHNTGAASYGWHVCVNGHTEGNLALFDEATANSGELAVKGWLHEDACKRLLEAVGLSYEEAFSRAMTPGFRAFDLGIRMDVDMDVVYSVSETSNVGGILPGTDLADEAVVFNGHWDHLGIGTPDDRGDAIYNGAADNASGMAALLLAAKIAGELPAPRRSLLFLSVSSEESGLFGSEYYTEHPVFPLEKTAACINFESVGPAPLTHDVSVLGGGATELDSYAIAAAAAQGRYIYFDDDNSDGWFFRSDHYNFFKRGVPALVFENGTQLVDPSRPNKYPYSEVYHKPTDEYHPDWDLTGTLANVNLLISLALSVANTPTPPAWLK